MDGQPRLDRLGHIYAPSFPTREGTFFGQIMVTDANNNLDGFYCYGPGADQNTVPGRLGANQGSVPYADAWPKSAGMDGQCETNHVVNGTDHGHCTAHTTNGTIDGDTSCTLNGTTYTHPLTVWRGATYQAESAEGGGFLTPGNAGTWSKGAYGYIANNCTTPGANGCGIIADANNGMGQRMGFIGPNKGVKFTNVTAPATTANLMVYYTNGDASNITRYLSFIVNGGAPQVKPFGGLNDWSHPRGAAVTLSGFNVNGNNTIHVTADPTHAAPDLDWIEVLGTESTLPSTGLCQESMWNVTSSVNSGAVASAVDSNLTNRWTTARAMQAGDYYQIDFTGTVNLTTITLDNSQDGSAGDFPGVVAVYTSQDGVTFSPTPVDTSPGASGHTVLSFPSEAMRAIRIQVVTANSNSNAWWSIGEIETDCSL